MKLTMHIDDALLDRVMKAHDITSKTGAVDFALREVDRRTTLKRLAETNLGLTEKEILTAFDDRYNILEMRVAEEPGVSAPVTTTKPKPVTYAKKPRSRR
ncbi:MAG: type II toxin-antitoxin system VapB family antitoxin [Prosthecobacter sp.]